MPTLGDMVARLESNYGAANARQPPSMVNPTYGQYGAFVRQFGDGEIGVNNFAQQTLAANPNATVGDFYAGYVLGTGVPGRYTAADLASTSVPGAQGAYNNMVRNSPIDPNAPLADYVNNPQGPSIPEGPVDNANGFNSGDLGSYQTAQVTPSTGSGVDSFGDRFGGVYSGTGGNAGDTPSIFFNPNPVTEQVAPQSPATITPNDAFNPQLTPVEGPPAGTVPTPPDFTGPRLTVTPNPPVSPGTSSGSGAGPTSGGTNPGGPTGTGDSSSGAGAGAGAGGGGGLKVDIGTQPSWVQLVQDTTKTIITAFGAGLAKVIQNSWQALTGLVGVGSNTALRVLVFLAGFILVLVALWKMLVPDHVKTEIVTAAKAAAAA